MFHGDHGGGQVEFHAAVLLGDGDAGQAQFGRLAHTGHGDAGLLVLDGFHVGADFLGPEFVHRAGDGQVFRSEILRGEDFVWQALFDQERAAFGFR